MPAIRQNNLSSSLSKIEHYVNLHDDQLYAELKEVNRIDTIDEAIQAVYELVMITPWHMTNEDREKMLLKVGAYAAAGLALSE